ncbi:hypothetical protein FACS1894137_18850 [Spirochaetia bacterium]|nr:hypothetical protein FACS1894137_18850 [Spirochaetia bacterium]
MGTFAVKSYSLNPSGPKPLNPSNPGMSSATATGSITVTSEIAGTIIVDGVDRTRIKSGGTATVQNVASGNTEVAVRGDDGKTYPSAETVFVRQGQNAAALVERPIPEGFVKINAGAFDMGSPPNEVDHEDDETQHRVTVSSFYMGKYEVTVGEFRRFANAAGYKTTAESSGGGDVLTDGGWETKADANWKNPYFSQGENQPVVLVSWYDAVRYCNWLSGQEGLSPAYTINGENVSWNRNANGYRLPTEAEWEYACRAGTPTPFSTGNNITTGQANYDGNYPYNNNSKGTYRKQTWVVDSGTPNAWGLYNMHGNVWEWCWDWYDAYSTGTQTDPRGAASGAGAVAPGTCGRPVGTTTRRRFVATATVSGLSVPEFCQGKQEPRIPARRLSLGGQRPDLRRKRHPRRYRLHRRAGRPCGNRVAGWKGY